MKITQSTSIHNRSERGQSVVMVAIGMTVLLLLVTGVLFFSVAFFTSTTMQQSDQEGPFFSLIAPEDISGVVTDVVGIDSTPTPGLGAVVGNQMNRLDVGEANVTMETDSP